MLPYVRMGKICLSKSDKAMCTIIPSTITLAALNIGPPSDDCTSMIVCKILLPIKRTIN